MDIDFVVLFVSFGWFISVAFFFLMFVRMRQMSEELKVVKYSVQVSDDELKVLEQSIMQFKKNEM